MGGLFYRENKIVVSRLDSGEIGTRNYWNQGMILNRGG